MVLSTFDEKIYIEKIWKEIQMLLVTILCNGTVNDALFFMLLCTSLF